MAILLFKYVQRKRNERQAQKAIPTTDDSHLVPEHISAQGVLNEHNLTSVPDSTGSHVNFLTPEEAAQQKAEARRNRIRHWKLLLRLVLPNFLAAMDVTIVAPAIPLISSHFDQLSGGFNWIVAAYTLTFTTFIPISGQLADIYGRHFALQFEMFWIMVGSVLCVSAQSWTMLLVGRALQGLGAAGIMSLSRIILSDGTSLADNASSNSILSLISGCSYAVGPVIGGSLADAGWRYIFVVPVGVSVLAMLVIALLMRKELVQGRTATNKHSSRRLGYILGLAIIDWPGATMFIFGVGCIILAMQWGGSQYAWSSPGVIAPFTVGGILCILFFIYEYLLGPGRAAARLFPRQIPMILSMLFRKKDTSLLMAMNFSAGISLVAAFYFISYYWQLAEGYSPSKAGLQLLFYTPGLGVGVYSAVTMCNFWPDQTVFPLMLGSVVEGVGLVVLTYSISIRHTVLVKVFVAITGAGTGLRFMPSALHAAGIWSTRVPSIQSLLGFMLPLGQTVGISMMGSVFSNKLATLLSRIISSTHGSVPFSSSTEIPSVELLDSLPPAVKTQVQNAAAKAIMWALVSVLPFMGLSILASLFLGNVWIGKKEERTANGKVEREEQKGRVMYGVYLLALCTGRIAESKRALDVDLQQEEMERMKPVELGTGV